MPTVVKVFRNPKIGDEADISLNLQSYVTDFELQDSYVVRYTDSTATPIDAASATDGTTTIPAIGSAYSGSGVGASLICQRAQPRRRRDAPDIFDVQVEWKNIVPQGGGAKWNINIDVRSVRYEQDAWVDKSTTGQGGVGPGPRPIMASNGQVYSPTLKKIYFDEEIRVSFNCGATEAGNVITATGDGVTTGAKGHYNNAAVTLNVNGVSRTFPTGTLLYAAPDYSTVYIGESPYDWKFELIFQYRVDGWLDNVPDRGTYKVIDLGVGVSPRYQKQVFTDAFGTPVTEPVLMNQGGDKLPDVAPTTLQTPLLNQYDNYAAASFTTLLSGL